MLSQDVWVICLCAQWCHQCRGLEPLFLALAAEQPAVKWSWVDIEDHSDMVDNLHINTFPTYMVIASDEIKFFGPGPAQTKLLPSFARMHANNSTRLFEGDEHLWNAYLALKSLPSNQ